MHKVILLAEPESVRYSLVRVRYQLDHDRAGPVTNKVAAEMLMIQVHESSACIIVRASEAKLATQ
jgi:hypothetical protein